MDEYLNFRDGLYIEAGANNGVAQSNTLALEKKGWIGLLIEPNKIRLSECRENRSDENIFENCALVSPDHSKPTIPGNFEEQNIDDSLVGQVTIPLDYYDSHQLEAAQDKAQNRKTVRVPAKTLQSLIDVNGIKKIDFLSLDVEGYEYEAMNGLDFVKNPPRYIRVETSSYSYRQDKMTKYMAARGYRFLGMPNINDCFYVFDPTNLEA